MIYLHSKKLFLIGAASILIAMALAFLLPYSPAKPLIGVVSTVLILILHIIDRKQYRQ